MPPRLCHLRHEPAVCKCLVHETELLWGRRCARQKPSLGLDRQLSIQVQAHVALRFGFLVLLFFLLCDTDNLVKALCTKGPV